ncbi:MAG: hypothetical protein VZS44_09420 [Bacilli bacterium]|nr:hypothetical protein [Bacilli bacterium]
METELKQQIYDLKEEIRMLKEQLKRQQETYQKMQKELLTYYDLYGTLQAIDKKKHI